MITVKAPRVLHVVPALFGGAGIIVGDAGRRVVPERFQWDHVVQRCLDAFQSS